MARFQALAGNRIILQMRGELIRVREAGGGFRPDIEGLRGVAVLLVVLFHSGVPGFRGGYIGVDVFFALSGYLITGLIVSEIEKKQTFSFGNFYARRVRRLLPASGLMVVCVLLAGLLLYSPLELSRYAIWGAYTSLYISNLMFMMKAGNYFAGTVAAHNPFLHTWSLAVEEQFYLLWPALIALAYSKSQSRRRLVISLFAVTALSLASCIWITYVHREWAFFSLPTRAWEFGGGGLLCLARKESLVGKKNLIRLLSWGGFFVLLAAGHYYGNVERIFPGSIAVVPIMATLAMLSEGAIGTPSLLQRMLALPPMQWLGRLSYSWYLWHWPFLTYARDWFPNLSWHGRLLVSGAALLTAQVTYKLLENPVRFHPRLVANPVLSLGLAVLVPIVGTSVSFAVGRQAKSILAEGPQHELEVASEVGSWHDCMVREEDHGLTECVFADKGSNTTVLLFGDSHAGQWFPAINAIAEERHWRLITLLKANCQIAAQALDSSGHVENPSCREWRASAMRRIASLRPSIVVLGESAGSVANPRMSARPVSVRQWQEGLITTLVQLEAVGANILVMADIPYSPFDVPVCLSRSLSAKWGASGCLITKASALNERVRDAEKLAVSSDSAARWVDFSPIFCSGVYCQTLVDNVVAYHDDNHISEPLAEHLVPQLARELDLLMGSAGGPGNPRQPKKSINRVPSE